MKNQMYVEELVPAGGARQRYPIIFIHGQAQTGTNWLNTPDERKGWASWFIQRGYTVYLLDQPQRGRSAYTPGDGTLATYSAEYISKLFTGVQRLSLWPQARFHTQWPGVSGDPKNGMMHGRRLIYDGERKTGQMGDAVYDSFYASQVQFQNDTATVQIIGQLAGAALLDIVGPATIITHSQGGPIGFLIADARPNLVNALISLEPTGPPFQDRVTTNNSRIVRPYGITNVPITYSPPVENPATDFRLLTSAPPHPDLSECYSQAPPVRQLPNLAWMPHLIVTSQASYHAAYDYCTVNYLRQAGVAVDFLDLPRFGVYGNAHLFFLELNNLEIAARVGVWIRRKFSILPV
ncbi:MAG: hypothetical protein LQ346_004817 [Caloplaca aetnensis]|nr:MAG: hypothetical protein LQ346_004817 [Caloplaca aetnensis]